MKIKSVAAAALICLTALSVQAQEVLNLSLDEAVRLAVSNSTEAAISDTRVATAGYDLNSVKNNVYPELKVSGQYLRLNQPNVNMLYDMGGNSEPGTDPQEKKASPEVGRVMFAQATLGMPIFSGFKLKNSIAASENALKAQTYSSASAREKLALQAVTMYANLYKAQQSVQLIRENLRGAQQRVTDFSAMEQNGLLARNDLLRAQLQASNVELSLEDARKTVSTLNYQLVTFLKLPQGTVIQPGEADFKTGEISNLSDAEAVGHRNDLEALRWQAKAQQANVKVAEADYYPSVGFTGGYVALDIENLMRVSNAVNVGVGVSYDISNLFKNQTRVKAAKSRAKETEQQAELLSDHIKVQMQEAFENYNLAIRQNRVFADATVQAVENYRIVKDKYDNGLSDTNDLLDADVQQLQAKINEMFSKADIAQRYYELLHAAGQLGQTFNFSSNNQ